MDNVGGYFVLGAALIFAVFALLGTLSQIEVQRCPYAKDEGVCDFPDKISAEMTNHFQCCICKRYEDNQ